MTHRGEHIHKHKLRHTLARWCVHRIGDVLLRRKPSTIIKYYIKGSKIKVKCNNNNNNNTNIE